MRFGSGPRLQGLAGGSSGRGLSPLPVVVHTNKLSEVCFLRFHREKTWPSAPSQELAELELGQRLSDSRAQLQSPLPCFPTGKVLRQLPALRFSRARDGRATHVWLHGKLVQR